LRAEPQTLNFAGPERFLVYDKVYDDFCDRVSKIVLGMRQVRHLVQCIRPLKLETLNL
jgi:hypothetical protein